LIPEREPEKRLPHLRKAAGAQITQYKRICEVVTRNINAWLFKSCNWNELNPNPLTSINWRASLVPAAAVIPAPIAYIKVVAVKKLVVEILQVKMGCLFEDVLYFDMHNSGFLSRQLERKRKRYFEKIRVFQAGVMP
jgi:hypothetical protein